MYKDNNTPYLYYAHVYVNIHSLSLSQLGDNRKSNLFYARWTIFRYPLCNIWVVRKYLAQFQDSILEFPSTFCICGISSFYAHICRYIYTDYIQITTAYVTVFRMNIRGNSTRFSMWCRPFLISWLRDISKSATFHYLQHLILGIIVACQRSTMILRNKPDN